MVDFPIDMSPRQGWGDWIEHNGDGCHLRIGDIFQPILRLKGWDNAVITQPSCLTTFGKNHFIWCLPADADYAVIQYRLLTDLSKVYEINQSVGASSLALDAFCRADFFAEQSQ